MGNVETEFWGFEDWGRRKMSLIVVVNQNSFAIYLFMLMTIVGAPLCDWGMLDPLYMDDVPVSTLLLA